MASPATTTSSRCAGSSASSPPRTPTPSGTAPAAPSPSPRCSSCTTTRSCHGCTTKEQGLEYAHGTGVVCNDEFLLHPDPYPSREAWCRARVAETGRRLAELPDDLPTVLVNHYPLDRHPTDVLWYPEFAMWCGTALTADWHRRFRVETMVYGHLHIPRTTWHEGVRFEEVSVGYPREWRQRPEPPGQLRRIVPGEVGAR